MSTPVTSVKWHHVPDTFEDIGPLPLADLAPRIVNPQVDIDSAASACLEQTANALKTEFTLFLQRSNPAPKIFIAFKLGEFGMLMHVTKADHDHKVHLALKVKKERNTPVVGKGETMEVVGRMYAITHSVLNEPTIKPMVAERVCGNKVFVHQAVLDKAKENNCTLYGDFFDCIHDCIRGDFFHAAQEPAQPAPGQPWPPACPTRRIS